MTETDVVEAEDARAAALQETKQKACSLPTFPVKVTAVAVVVEEEEDVFTVEPVLVVLTGDVAAQAVVVVVVESVDFVAPLLTSRIQEPLVETSMVIWTWVKRRRALILTSDPGEALDLVQQHSLFRQMTISSFL